MLLNVRGSTDGSDRVYACESGRAGLQGKRPPQTQANLGFNPGFTIYLLCGLRQSSNFPESHFPQV